MRQRREVTKGAWSNTRCCSSSFTDWSSSARRYPEPRQQAPRPSCHIHGQALRSMRCSDATCEACCDVPHPSSRIGRTDGGRRDGSPVSRQPARSTMRRTGRAETPLMPVNSSIFPELMALQSSRLRADDARDTIPRYAANRSDLSHDDRGAAISLHAPNLGRVPPRAGARCPGRAHR